MEFLTMILTLMLCFFSTSYHSFPCPTVSVNFYSFVYVLLDRHVICIVNSISSLDELFLLLEQMLQNNNNN